MARRHIYGAVIGLAYCAAFAVYANDRIDKPDGIVLSSVELKDQFKDEYAIEFPTDHVVVFVIADRKGSEDVEPWVRALYEKYEDTIQIEGIALVSGVPKPLRGVVRALFKSNVPKPIMLDWDGSTCDQFGYKNGAVETYVLNAEGEVLMSKRGPCTETKLVAVCEAIDAAMEVTEEE
jgi:hypothetical protein